MKFVLKTNGFALGSMNCGTMVTNNNRDPWFDSIRQYSDLLFTVNYT